MPGSTPPSNLPPTATVLLASGVISGAGVLGAGAFNVSSITRNSAGTFTLNFTNAITGTYFVRITATGVNLVDVGTQSHTTTTAQVLCRVGAALTPTDLTAAQRIFFEVFQ